MFKAVLGLVIVALVASACAAKPEKFRYHTLEQLCADLATTPSWNIWHKSRVAALEERNGNCDDADYAEIRRIMSKEKSFSERLDEAYARQAQEKANKLKIKDCSKYDGGGFWAGVMKNMDGY